MRCERCGADHPPGACAEAGPPRVRALVVASALYLVIALVSLAMKNVVFAVVTGAVGFFLLRAAPLAIGSALVLSAVGVLTNGMVLAAASGLGPPLIERETLESQVVMLAVLQIVLHAVVLLLLLSPSSRRLLREARSKRR